MIIIKKMTAKKGNKYDLIVIGGGTAGLRASLYSASQFYKTALIDPGILGGTCLNTGCIPTKAMLHSANLFKQSNNLKKFGIIAPKTEFNFEEIMNHVKKIIDNGQEHISKSIQNKNLEIISERAVFISRDEIKAGKQKLIGEKFIICTGAKPRIPALKGIENVDYFLSDDIINLKKLPSSIIITGGGYIALEFATFFNSLGAKVSIIERNERLLKDIDAEVSEYLKNHYRSIGIIIKTNAEVLELRQDVIKKVIFTSLDEGTTQSISADEILIATGRSPNTFGLDLESAGVRQGEKGNILINNNLQTSNKKIYAVGDVTGRTPFAHAAKRESHIALVNALEGKKEKMNFELVPWAIFTNPPIGGVGISEEQAIEKKIKYGILKALFARAGRATIIDETSGFVKIIYDKKTKKILGGIIIGPRADDIIHEIVALMNVNGTIIDLRNTIHIHPTLSEVFEALKEVD